MGRIVVIVLLLVGCGKKAGKDKAVDEEPAGSGTAGSAVAAAPGCTGPGHTLVKLGGDFDKTWCVTIYFGGFDDCINFPPPETGFDVNVDDPDAKNPDQSTRFRLQLREQLATGIVYTLEKGPDGTVVKGRGADGAEVSADGVGFTWDVFRDGTAFMAGMNQDGWTTGTIRVTQVPQKKCEDYTLAFDLELHHPGMKSPAKLTATGVAFR